MKTLRTALTAGLLLLTLGACSAGPVASPTPSVPATPDPTATPAPPTQVPGGIGSQDPDGGVVGGGGGAVDPAPGDGGPTFVLPKPGTQDPAPVSVESLEALVDGRRVILVATWWSGVEPCYTLDSVNVKRDGNDFTVQVLEGHGGGDVACIEIAMQKATRINLGELEPGDYTVVAEDSTAEPVTFTVA